jgi:hypothetical protein
LAGWNKLGHHRHCAIGLRLANLDQAHTATGYDGQFVVPAVMWYFKAGLFGGLNQVLIGINVDFDFVDYNATHFGSSIHRIV